ncbi:MAG: ATP-binding protein, partial [Pseudomonadota bacterium]
DATTGIRYGYPDKPVGRSSGNFNAYTPAIRRELDRVGQQNSHDLLSNAIKFTPDGGRVGVEVSAGPADRFVRIAISDTGCGISEQDQKLVFDRLYQVKRDGDELEARQGLGLGLSIARQLVLQHGGELTVNSEVGKGSTFTFTMPADQQGRRAA